MHPLFFELRLELILVIPTNEEIAELKPLAPAMVEEWNGAQPKEPIRLV
jgi:hypothetical protein